MVGYSENRPKRMGTMVVTDVSVGQPYLPKEYEEFVYDREKLSECEAFVNSVHG